MISPSLHPDPVTARCQTRGRWAFGLTGRTIFLLLLGFLGIVPGFWDARLAYSMLAWDALVLLIALLDGLRLPAPTELAATRSWSNAPALDSDTEIELTLENHGKLIVACRLTDDLPAALIEHPAVHRLTVYPRVPASLRYRVRPGERGNCETGWLYLRYRSGLGLVERWARAPLTQQVRVYPALRTGEEQQIFLARSRQIDLQLRQARLRGLGRDFESLREYRQGDDLRDICWTATARRGDLITRQYQTERSQAVWIVLDCGRLMRTRVKSASSSAKGTGFSPRGSTPLQARPRLYNRGRPGSARSLLRGSRRPSGLWPIHPAAHSSRPRCRAHAPINRGSRTGAFRTERSRSPARHGNPQPAAAAPIFDSLDHRSG